MCYTASLTTDLKKMKERFHRLVKEDDDLGLPFRDVSAFARPLWPVITTEEPQAFTRLQWGLVPPFAREDPKAFLAKSPTFNAISEDLIKDPDKKRSFAGPWKNGQRCLIPVSNFKEWQHRAVEGRKTPNKVPFHIKLQGAEIFCLAGLFDGSTYTILTRPANTLMAEIHNNKKRMPCIIKREHENDWLSPSLTLDDVAAMCDETFEGELEALEEMPSQHSLF
jgi:putative SOS response-associated peptidase YedK